MKCEVDFTDDVMKLKLWNKFVNMTSKLCDLGIFGDKKGGLEVIRKIVTFYHILENYKLQQTTAQYKRLCYCLLGELLSGPVLD